MTAQSKIFDLTRAVEALTRRLDADAKDMLTFRPADDRLFIDEVLLPAQAPATPSIDASQAFTDGQHRMALERHARAFESWAKSNYQRVLVLAYTARMHGLQMQTLSGFRASAATRTLGGADGDSA